MTSGATAAGPLIPRKRRAPGCTRKTARCEFWTWGHDYVRPECCTGHLRALLFFTGDLLARHGLTHWLDWGSLLGAVRHGTFIPRDSDVDWGVLDTDFAALRTLEPEIIRAGFQLDARDPFVWRINRSVMNTQHVDLYPWRRDGGRLVLDWPGRSVDHWTFPASFVASGTTVQLYGRTFPAPAPVHELLARYRYGADYMTPRRPDGRPDPALQMLGAREEEVITSLTLTRS